MLGNHTALHVKEPADGFLGQPDGAVLDTHLNTLLVGVFREDQKIHGAVANLAFGFLHRCLTFSQSAVYHIRQKSGIAILAIWG